MARTRLASLLGFVFLLAACGAGETTSEGTGSAPDQTVATTALSTGAGGSQDPSATSSNPSTEPAGSQDTDPPQTSSTTSGGPPAPDFTLALDGGGEFRLADEARPVFMVFWAEW